MKSILAICTLLCAAALLAGSGIYAPPLTGRTGSCGGSPPAIVRPTPARRGWATWYSRASCRREGTGGREVLMANGKPLRDDALTCAMWLTNSAGRVQRPDGRLVTVRCVQTGRCLQVRWTDNGPGRLARRRGVIVDMTPAAMRALDGSTGIEAGRVEVEIER